MNPAYRKPDPASQAHIARHLTSLTLLGRRPTTIYARKRQLLRLARALPVPLLTASPGMLLAWRAALTLTPDGICACVSHARQFYEWAVDEGFIEANPAAKVPVPRKRDRLPRPISETDLLTALDGADPRVRVMIILAAWAGLRCCEIARLRARNILLHETPPRILLEADGTKGGVWERIVPLCPFAAAELAAAGLPVRGWAFTRVDGRLGPNTAHHVSQIINQHLRDCGISATAHQLRHRLGSKAYEGSLDIVAVQHVMGHRHLSTTQGYVLLNDASAAAAVATLPVPRRLRPVQDTQTG